MSAPGGFRIRQFEAELDMLSSPEETVLRHRRAQLLADYVRDNIALRLPLPDILRYARDWNAEHGPAHVRARLYHLMNEQHRGDRASVPPE